MRVQLAVAHVERRLVGRRRRAAATSLKTSRMRRYESTVTPWPSWPGKSMPQTDDVRDRVGRLEHGLLARVALGAGVRDVVGRDVERPLLRDQAAQRDVDAVEGRDAHQARASRIAIGDSE